jgi:hypothetical protein
MDKVTVYGTDGGYMYLKPGKLVVVRNGKRIELKLSDAMINKLYKLFNSKCQRRLQIGHYHQITICNIDFGICVNGRRFYIYIYNGYIGNNIFKFGTLD